MSEKTIWRLSDTVLDFIQGYLIRKDKFKNHINLKLINNQPRKVSVLNEGMNQ